MWGPNEIDLNQRVGVQHDGLLRVRRSLMTSVAVLAVLAGFVAIFGSLETAFGIAAIFIGPLVLILAGLQVIVEITRPKKRAAPPGPQ
ncbi:MAG: hypothetical protein AB8G26_20575 [Ilumatobacter sp.]